MAPDPEHHPVIDLREDPPPRLVDGRWVDADGKPLPFLSIWQPDETGRMRMIWTSDDGEC